MVEPLGVRLDQATFPGGAWTYIREEEREGEHGRAAHVQHPGSLR